MSTIWVVDIDNTISDGSHREHHLKQSCISCANLVSHNHVGNCPNCYCDLFTIPTSSWKSFTNPLLLANDKPIIPAQKVVLSALRQGIEIHYITGRQNNAREVTQKWLEEHFKFDRKINMLLMREVDSYTTESKHLSASVHKERAFNFLVNSQGYYINSADFTFMFFDDDKYVLPMYSKYGTTFKAPECWAYMNNESPKSAEPLFNK